MSHHATIGVVGAGTIGRGVAQAFAEHAYRVVLVDSQQRQLDCAEDDIRLSARTQSLFLGPAKEPGGRGKPLDITYTTDLVRLEAADYVIENVTEDWEVKLDLYQRLDEVLPSDRIIAVNTSAIPITSLAAVTCRPPKIIGAHFMNPVPLIATVEVIRGLLTSDETLSETAELLRSIGKEYIVVGDSPGFVTNRVLMLTINEAIFCVQDEVASAADIDQIFKGCLGHKMGPLETGDLIGLDTILNSITVLYDNYCDSKYRPAPLLRRMVAAGMLGQKSGKGFYDYADE